MNIVLILPPCGQKCSEPFTLPNMSLAMLARELSSAGHKVRQIDAEKIWFEKLRSLLKKDELEALMDTAAVRAYVNGSRLPRRKKESLAAVSAAILRHLDIPPCDLCGISLIDMKVEPLGINFPALAAAAIKAKFGCKVVIGGKNVPAQAFVQLMRTFRVYDYGVYARRGERSLLRIADRLSGKGGKLFKTVAREKRGLKDYSSHEAWRPEIQFPEYDAAVLKNYTYGAGEILSRYNSGFKAARALIKTKKKYLVVPYLFELSCPNICAFCDNDAAAPSDRKGLDEVMDDLGRLKERGVSGLYIVNSAFNNSYKFAWDLCDRMIKEKLGFRWISCANLKFVDRPLLDKMKAAGAVKLTWGTETFSQRLLNYVRKGITLQKVRETLSYADKIGIFNHIELIAGLPTETERDIADALGFIRENRSVIDIYTLNQFHLYSESPFGRKPGDFGLKVRKYPPLGRMNFFHPPDRKVGEYTLMFDEAGGLKWEEKNLQISESFERLSSEINRLRGFNAAEEEHPYLLLLLRDAFGDRKPMIKKFLEALTYRYKPYNLDFFLENRGIGCGCTKEGDKRRLYPLKKFPLFAAPATEKNAAGARGAGF